MLDVVDAMRHEAGRQDLGSGRRPDTPDDVLRALAKAKDNGTEIRDLAEAGIDTDPVQGGRSAPRRLPRRTHMAAEEEVEATLAELGEYADDTTDAETAEAGPGPAHRQRPRRPASTPTSTPPGPSWATALQELADARRAERGGRARGGAGRGRRPDLTRESLVGKEIAEIKALAKAAGIEGYSKMRREPLINALLGVEPEPAAAAPPARKATGAAKKAARARQQRRRRSGGCRHHRGRRRAHRRCRRLQAGGDAVDRLMPRSSKDDWDTPGGPGGQEELTRRPWSHPRRCASPLPPVAGGGRRDRRRAHLEGHRQAGGVQHLPP